MVGNAGQVVDEQIVAGGVVGPKIHEMDVRVPLGAAGGGMDVEAAEVSDEVDGFLDGQVGEILVEKDEDFSLGGQKGELVFAGVREAAELDAGDGGAASGRDILFPYGGSKEVGKGLVGILAVIDVLEGF